MASAILAGFGAFKLHAIILAATALTLMVNHSVVMSGESGGRHIEVTTDGPGVGGSFGDERAVITFNDWKFGETRVEVTAEAVRVDGVLAAKLPPKVEDIRLRHTDGFLLLFVNGELIEFER